MLICVMLCYPQSIFMESVLGRVWGADKSSEGLRDLLEVVLYRRAGTAGTFLLSYPGRRFMLLLLVKRGVGPDQ